MFSKHLTDFSIDVGPAFHGPGSAKYFQIAYQSEYMGRGRNSFFASRDSIYGIRMTIIPCGGSVLAVSGVFPDDPEYRHETTTVSTDSVVFYEATDKSRVHSYGLRAGNLFKCHKFCPDPVVKAGIRELMMSLKVYHLKLIAKESKWIGG